MRRRKTKVLDIREFITLHAVMDEGSDSVWIHTHGMTEKLRLPAELEIRGIPPHRVRDGGALLNHAARHVVLGGSKARDVVKVGDVIDVPLRGRVRVCKARRRKGDGHDKYPVWELKPCDLTWDRVLRGPFLRRT